MPNNKKVYILDEDQLTEQMKKAYHASFATAVVYWPWVQERFANFFASWTEVNGPNFLLEAGTPELLLISQERLSNAFYEFLAARHPDYLPTDPHREIRHIDLQRLQCVTRAGEVFMWLPCGIVALTIDPATEEDDKTVTFGYPLNTISRFSLSEDERYYMLKAMRTYGGSFVRQLAECLELADVTNFNKLANIFSEYVFEYLKKGRDMIPHVVKDTLLPWDDDSVGGNHQKDDEGSA